MPDNRILGTQILETIGLGNVSGRNKMLGNRLTAWLTLGLVLIAPQVQAAVTLQGKLEQGALMRGQAPAGTQISLNGEAIKVTPDGHFAFGFDRDGELSQQLTSVKPSG